MNQGKSFSIIGLRPSKIGDIITSLPVLNLLEQQYPNSYKTVSIAKKCSVCIPLLYNQPFIDRLHVNEILENPNKEDIDFFNSHDLIIPPNLQHPIPLWYNYVGMVQENFLMMGLDWNELEPEKRIPKLVKWFDTPNYSKTISIWPMAGSGQDKRRGPTSEWFQKLVDLILKDLPEYNIYQFGHPDDFCIFNEYHDFNKCANFNHLEFFEQIKMTLGCSMGIFTDAGSSLIMGAYGFPQITVLCPWNYMHTSNFTALEPMNSNNISLIGQPTCDDILQESVLEKIKLLL